VTLNADALIIGIDKYDCGDIQPLPGCVNDAVAAAKWLIAISVPPKRIIAHVSPLNPELFPADVVVLAADDKAVRASFAKLAKSGSGDKLFLFMSGHGKYVPGAGPIFLCQDYYVNGSTRENLKIEEYIPWLRSWRYRDQFLFYDACQDATASVGQLSSVQASGPDPLPGTFQPDSGVAFTACYACSPGETAWAGDGRGVLVRHSLDELDPKLWDDLHPDAPEQDAIQYDWTTGARVVDLDKLFTNIIAVKITEAANVGQKFQTPFCQSYGRALVDGFSPILELRSLPMTTVTVLIDPQLAVGDVQSIKLQSQIIPRACFMPSKGTPLKIPATLKFPLRDQLNAGCRLTPNSTWGPVNVPLIQMLAKPNEDIVLQFRSPPPDSPQKDFGLGEINIVLDGGIRSLPPEIARQLRPDGGPGGSGFPPGITLRKEASGPAIGFDPKIAGSILSANQIGVDWLKATRRYNRDTGKRVILSPVGQPKSLRPNIHFDFGESSAAGIGGFLQNDECVTLESLSDEMPPRVMSLGDLEDHPLEWLEPGQCRISIDLPWGRWTSRVRVGKKVTTVRLPPTVGLEPLRNRYRRGDAPGPTLIRPAEGADEAGVPFTILRDGGRRFWALATSRVPVVVLASESGIRVEPFSETSLREWDELLTVGRLDIDNAVDLVKKLDGKVPDGTAEDFGMFALAAAYVEYNRQNWSGLRTIIEVMEHHEVHFPDLDLLKLAVDISDERFVGNERQHAITYGLVERPLQLPILRWGVMLFADLVQQAELVLPAWVNAFDSTSVVTLVNQSGLAALGFDPAVVAVPAHPEHQDAVRAGDIEPEIPLWLQGNPGGIWEHLVATKKPMRLLEGPAEQASEEDSVEQAQMRESNDPA
jgi:hypothetical protein